jgi:hypothetical protein
MIYKKLVKNAHDHKKGKWKQDKERNRPKRGGGQAYKFHVTKLSFDIYNISNSS